MLKKSLFVSVLIFLINPILWSNLSPIDGSKICDHIKELASDEYEGREIGTRGEKKTIDYIQNQYKEIGLEPLSDGTYLQEVRLAKFNVIPPSKVKLRNVDKEVLR